MLISLEKQPEVNLQRIIYKNAQLLKQLIYTLLANMLLTGFFVSAQAQELSYSKRAYFLAGKESELDALRHELKLNPLLQVEFDRLKKWEYTSSRSGNLFLLTSGATGLALGTAHLIWNYTNIFVVTPIFGLQFAFLAILTATTASISLITWSIAAIRASNLRTEFLYHYNYSLSTNAQETLLEFGLNSGGVGFTLKF